MDSLSGPQACPDQSSFTDYFCVPALPMCGSGLGRQFLSVRPCNRYRLSADSFWISFPGITEFVADVEFYLFVFKRLASGSKNEKMQEFWLQSTVSAKLPKSLPVLVHWSRVFLFLWTRFVLSSVGTWELFRGDWFCVFSTNRVMNGLPANLPCEIPNMTSLEKKNAS